MSELNNWNNVDLLLKITFAGQQCHSIVSTAATYEGAVIGFVVGTITATVICIGVFAVVYIKIRYALCSSNSR